MRYSIWSLINQALTGNRNWTSVWREPEPKSHYDIVIVGGGGHGLATAFYLASRYGKKNIAVLEKGWIGSSQIFAITNHRKSGRMLMSMAGTTMPRLVFRQPVQVVQIIGEHGTETFNRL